MCVYECMQARCKIPAYVQSHGYYIARAHTRRDGHTLVPKSHIHIKKKNTRRNGYTLVSKLRGHMAPALGVAVHPSGKLMATCSCDQTTVVWSVPQRGQGHDDQSPDASRWQSVATILGHNDYVKACAFRTDGKMLATASRDRCAWVVCRLRLCVCVCV